MKENERIEQAIRAVFEPGISHIRRAVGHPAAAMMTDSVIGVMKARLAAVSALMVGHVTDETSLVLASLQGSRRSADQTNVGRELTGEVADLGQQRAGLGVQVERVGEDLDPGPADNMPGRLAGASGVDQVPARQAERGAVCEHLVQIRVRVSVRLIPAPTGARFQPVDANEVAERMAALALGEPSGLVPDLAGPRIYTFAELVTSYLSAAGQRRPLLPVRIPGQAARAIRAGANLAPDRAAGKRTWEEFLAERL